MAHRGSRASLLLWQLAGLTKSSSLVGLGPPPSFVGPQVAQKQTHHTSLSDWLGSDAKTIRYVGVIRSFFFIEHLHTL